jgi:hypothetical protein
MSGAFTSPIRVALGAAYVDPSVGGAIEIDDVLIDY